MNRNKHRIIGFEIAALIFLLSASVWQFGFSENADKLSSEWQAHIIQEVQYPILNSLRELADEVAVNDEETKIKLAESIRQSVTRATIGLNKKIKDRQEYQDGQQSLFQTIRNILFILGRVDK